MIKYRRIPEWSERIAAEKAFPPYTFVPGLTAHPEKDPGGHAYNNVQSDSIMYSETNWQTSHTYKYGFDLFNFGYYWEAHESWEKIWQQLKNNYEINHNLKGLIKISAAGVKIFQKNLDGFESHMTKATHHFRKLLQLHQKETRVWAYYSDLLSFIQDQRSRKDLIIRNNITPPANVFGAVIYPENV
jgi:hypothetical protein